MRRPSSLVLATALALASAACAVSSPRAAVAQAPAARVRHTAADVQFMSGMIGHHSQAIDMSVLAPTRAASASVRTLAERIIASQKDEIAIMQQWLRERGQPVPGAGSAAPSATHGAHAGMDHGAAHQMAMPGMLTPAQMQQLEQAKGAEFDRLYLTFMIQHHRGALAMVKELFATDGAGQDDTVFKFASDANVDQTTEIARMERMLFALLLEKGTP